MWMNLAAAAVLLLLVAAGCLLMAAFKKGSKYPPADGQSRVTGSCGDSMAVRLTFIGQRVVAATARSDGCAYSCTCALAAARLARGRTAAEILDISPAAIGRAAGGVPEDHRHCTTLAAAALQAAVDDHMQKKR
jgi:nitrogen fixation NifU-like protein